MSMNKKYLYTILSIFIIIIFGISVVSVNTEYLEEKTVETSSTIDNKKFEWGIKREKNHIQPDVGAKNKEIMNKYNGIYMGNREKPYVYLSFDEGYEAGYTNQILDTLKENNVSATFFITAHYLNTASDLVERMLAEGHIVGNHTVNHKSMPSLSDEQVKSEVLKLHQTVYEKFAYEMKYIRPPMGEFSERTLTLTNSIGYKTVMWSLAYDDWDENNQGREEYATAKILDNIHNGAIILLHANSKDNANILGNIIKQVRNMGYEFRSLDEFVN